MAQQRLNPQNLAQFIDHTLLTPTATPQNIHQLCDEAIRFGFYSVCIHPSYLPLACERLKNQQPKAIAVVGFPLGANTAQTKIREACEAIENGAAEIDTVINLGALKSGNYELLEREISELTKACEKIPVKIIIETSYLTYLEKIEACWVSLNGGAQFVKTSTGFAPSGANVEDICLMRKIVGKSMGVKASGGIKNFWQAFQMIEAGASRLGTSNGVEIVKPPLSSPSGEWTSHGY